MINQMMKSRTCASSLLRNRDRLKDTKASFGPVPGRLLRHYREAGRRGGQDGQGVYSGRDEGRLLDPDEVAGGVQWTAQRPEVRDRQRGGHESGRVAGRQQARPHSRDGHQRPDLGGGRAAEGVGGPGQGREARGVGAEKVMSKRYECPHRPGKCSAAAQHALLISNTAFLCSLRNLRLR